VTDHRRLAHRIAERLFTNGQGVRAARLVLTIDGPPKRDLGGWCEEAVVDRIVEVLGAEDLDVNDPGPRQTARSREPLRPDENR